MQEQGDDALVARCRSGDESAFQELIERFQSKVFTLLYRMVRDRETALDLAQEAFLKIFRRFELLQNPGRLSSWVMQVAHNTGLDWLKKRRVNAVPADLDDQLTQQKIQPFLQAAEQFDPEALILQMSPNRLSDLLDELDDKYRTVLTLRYVEGYSFKEIADIMGLPLSTVKFRKHYAIRMLEERWLQKFGRSLET